MFNHNNPQSTTCLTGSSLPSDLSSSSSSLNPAVDSPSRSIEHHLLPNYLKCPILGKKMRDPVFAADGHTYERSAITSWIQTHDDRATSPMTGEQLEHLKLTPNLLLRQMIIAYEGSKPQREQHRLTEDDISLAIPLCEEELHDVLVKQGKKMVAGERDAVREQLVLQAKEIALLRQENQALKDPQQLPKDAHFVVLNHEMTRLEKQLELERQNHAASLIQKVYHRHSLRNILRNEYLHSEKEALLARQEKLQNEFAKEEAAFEETISTLATQKQWAEVTKQGQLAEAANKNHVAALGVVGESLSQVEEVKLEKYRRILYHTNRFHQAAESKERYQESMVRTMHHQQQAYVEWGVYLTGRHHIIQKKVFASKARHLMFQPAISSTLASLSQPQTALKFNQSVSPAQMELQNELAKADYDVDSEEVKKLEEQRAADPAISDKNGQQPLAAAIGELAPPLAASGGIQVFSDLILESNDTSSESDSEEDLSTEPTGDSDNSQRSSDNTDSDSDEESDPDYSNDDGNKQPKSKVKEEILPVLEISSPLRIDLSSVTSRVPDGPELSPSMLLLSERDLVRATPSAFAESYAAVEAIRNEEEKVVVTSADKIALQKDADEGLKYEQREIKKLKIEIEELIANKQKLNNTLKKIVPMEKGLLKQRKYIQLLIKNLRELHDNHVRNNELEKNKLKKNETLKKDIMNLAKGYDVLMEVQDPQVLKHYESIEGLMKSNEIPLDKICQKIKQLQDIENDLSRNSIGKIQDSSRYLEDEIDKKRQLILEKQSIIRQAVDRCASKVSKAIDACDKLKDKTGKAVLIILEYIEIIKALEVSMLKDNLNTVTECVEAFELLFEAYKNPNVQDKQILIQQKVLLKIDAIGIKIGKLGLEERRAKFMGTIINYFINAFPKEKDFRRIEIHKKILKNILKKAAKLSQSISTNDAIANGIVEQDDITFKNYLDNLVKAANSQNTSHLSLFCLFTPCEQEMRKILFKFFGEKKIIKLLERKHPAANPVDWIGTDYSFLHRSLPAAISQESCSSSEAARTPPANRRKIFTRNLNFTGTSSSVPFLGVYKIGRRLSDDTGSPRANSSAHNNEEAESLEQFKHSANASMVSVHLTVPNLKR